MESKNPITVKLLIDTNANKVLFAEASKDFIDFLFFLLSLPIGTVIKVLADNNSLSGSIGNLYTSFQNLNESYLEPNLNKSILLNPKPLISLSKVPLLMGTSNYNTSNGGYYAAYNDSSNASYVKGGTSYMVTDDLSVTPMSMISSISMMNKFNVSNLSLLQEQIVQVGTIEALAVLRASLRSSSTSLTDVFLRRM